MTVEDLIFVEHCSWRDNTYLIDIAVIRGVNADTIIFDAMKLVDDGFAIDIEDGLFQLRFDALQHLYL